jgi:hypothetical protein
VVVVVAPMVSLGVASKITDMGTVGGVSVRGVEKGWGKTSGAIEIEGLVSVVVVVSTELIGKSDWNEAWEGVRAPLPLLEPCVVLVFVVVLLLFLRDREVGIEGSAGVVTRESTEDRAAEEEEEEADEREFEGRGVDPSNVNIPNVPDDREA